MDFFGVDILPFHIDPFVTRYTLLFQILKMALKLRGIKKE